MRELVELNRYLHDFASALFFAGSLLIYILWRESPRGERSSETREALAGVSGKMWYLTVPSLVIALASGGVRAATFAEYEYVGEVTGSIITLLVVKHVLYTAIAGWGIRVHWKARSGAKPAPVVSQNGKH